MPLLTIYPVPPEDLMGLFSAQAGRRNPFGLKGHFSLTPLHHPRPVNVLACLRGRSWHQLCGGRILRLASQPWRSWQAPTVGATAFNQARKRPTPQTGPDANDFSLLWAGEAFVTGAAPTVTPIPSASMARPALRPANSKGESFWKATKRRQPLDAWRPAPPCCS